jgi:hypothetical protein
LINTSRLFSLDENSEKYLQLSHLLIREIVAEHLRYKNIGQDGCHICQIVTGDETWASHITPYSELQSLEWHHSY